MKKDVTLTDFNTCLETILRDGAKRLLQQAIENEVKEYLEIH